MPRLSIPRERQRLGGARTWRSLLFLDGLEQICGLPFLQKMSLHWFPSFFLLPGLRRIMQSEACSESPPAQLPNHSADMGSGTHSHPARGWLCLMRTAFLPLLSSPHPILPFSFSFPSFSSSLMRSDFSTQVFQAAITNPRTLYVRHRGKKSFWR